MIDSCQSFSWRPPRFAAVVLSGTISGKLAASIGAQDETMSRIFINYRRQDSEGYVGRLYDHLVQHFDAGDVFMDVDDIPPGADFVQVLEDAVFTASLSRRRCLTARFTSCRCTIRRWYCTAPARKRRCTEILRNSSCLSDRTRVPRQERRPQWKHGEPTRSG
jgi:hypothetical protein